MKFEKLPEDSEFDCRIAFNSQEEAEVISAVYAEHIANLAKVGNIGSIQPFDILMSNYSGAEDETYPYQTFRSAQSLIEMVQDFHDNTDEAATEIALDGSQPSYKNCHISERLELGEKALKLIEKLQEEAFIGDDVRSLRDLPETEPDRNINL